MAGYDKLAPADNSFISAFPANERALRAFLETIMGINHVVTLGADQGKHHLINMMDVTDDPAPIAGQGQFYMKVTEFGTDLFYMTGEGTIINLVKGDEVPVTLPNTDIEVLSVYAGYYLGRVAELVIDDGDIEIDWTAAMYFLYDNTESHTITFTGMPAIGSEIGQTICLNIENAGAFGIILDTEVGYSVYKRAADIGVALAGRTRLICTVDQAGIVDVVPLLDFVPNV